MVINLYDILSFLLEFDINHIYRIELVKDPKRPDGEMITLDFKKVFYRRMGSYEILCYNNSVEIKSFDGHDPKWKDVVLETLIKFNNDKNALDKT